MATTFTNESKNDSSFENEDNKDMVPAGKFGKAKFGRSKFGTASPQDISDYTNESKNSSNFNNETKN